MSQRTWACVPCRKSYRRPWNVPAFACPSCKASCEFVHWKVRIPSPRRPRAWRRFWDEYRAEKALLDRHRRGELREGVLLKILNLSLHVARPHPVPGPRGKKSP